jgi:hypothetical protein
MSKDSNFFIQKSIFAVVRKNKFVNVKKSNLSKRVKRSNLVATRENNLVKRESRRIHFAQKRKIVSESKKLIIVSLSKNKRTKIHYFVFIINCFSRNLNTIQFFFESQKTKTIDIMRIFSQASRSTHCTFKKLWSKRKLFFFLLESRKFRHRRCNFFKNSFSIQSTIRIFSI